MTDKSGNMAICTPDAYEKIGETHVKKDVIVSWERIEETQKIIGAHLKCLNLVVPLMYLLMKDQKELGPDNFLKTLTSMWGVNQEMSEKEFQVFWRG